MRIKILILLVIPVLFPGCNKFLDVTPKGYTIPSKYIDYRNLMNDGQTLAKAQEAYPAYLTDDALLGDNTMFRSFNSATEQARRLYSFAKGPVFPDATSDPFWDLTYSRIYTFNTVITKVMSATDGTEEDKRNCRAEALVGRAFEFMCLVGAYSPVYKEATASTDLGIPLIYNIDVGDLNYQRNTVAQVYDRIEQDLKESLPDLLDKVPNNFRPAKFVAYAFLARMYLMMGKYEKCLANAEQALAVSNALVDMKQYTIKPNLNLGKIVQKTTGAPYPVGKDSPENIYVRYFPSTYALHSFLYASTDLLDVYRKDLPAGAVDKRRQLWFADNAFLTNTFPGYTLYCPGIASNLGLNNMEVILDAAECYARIGGAGNLQKAADLYNLLRDNRIEGNVRVTFTSDLDALTKVLDERRREFAMLGTYRLIDLKRLNEDPRFAKTIVHTADGQTYSLPPRDNRYILPLPPKVKAFHPDLPDIDR